VKKLAIVITILIACFSRTSNRGIDLDRMREAGL
jgi:hypothetical protein